MKISEEMKDRIAAFDSEQVVTAMSVNAYMNACKRGSPPRLRKRGKGAAKLSCQLTAELSTGQQKAVEECAARLKITYSAALRGIIDWNLTRAEEKQKRQKVPRMSSEAKREHEYLIQCSAHMAGLKLTTQF